MFTVKWLRSALHVEVKTVFYLAGLNKYSKSQFKNQFRQFFRHAGENRHPAFLSSGFRRNDGNGIAPLIMICCTKFRPLYQTCGGVTGDIDSTVIFRPSHLD